MKHDVELKSMKFSITFHFPFDGVLPACIMSFLHHQPHELKSWGQVKRPIQTPARHLLEADTFHYGRTCCRGQLLQTGGLLCRLQQREVQVNKQVQLKEEVKRWLTIFHHMYKYTAHYINILKSTFAKSSKSQSWINQNPAGGLLRSRGVSHPMVYNFSQMEKSKQKSPKKTFTLYQTTDHT